jgi:hypothetical protein
MSETSAARFAPQMEELAASSGRLGEAHAIEHTRASRNLPLPGDSGTITRLTEQYE